MADENKVFDVEIITPDRVFFTGTATMIEFNTAAGELGVYARHIPLTTVLAPGVVTIHKQGEEDIIAAVHSGFAEILPEKVTLLAEIAEWPNEIDKARAEAAKPAPRSVLPIGQRRLMSSVPSLRCARRWCVSILPDNKNGKSGKPDFPVFCVYLLLEKISVLVYT